MKNQSDKRDKPGNEAIPASQRQPKINIIFLLIVFSNLIPQETKAGRLNLELSSTSELFSLGPYSRKETHHIKS